MRSLRLELGERSYSIHIGRDLEAKLHERLDGRRRAVALVDARLPELQAERLDRYLGRTPRLLVPRGEGSKSLAQLERLALALLDLGVTRDGLLIAVGGGVTGDLCGMLAASYFRGIPFIQVPTTLLAQVDASVGGKVAVNLPGAKNALGFFHQPEAVIADLAFLDSLELREKRAGLAELIKTAAIADPELLDEIEAKLSSLIESNGEELERSVLASCRIKAEVVRQDERESGLREILNFGHTLGHAIEGAAPEPAWLHGEAVGLGMLAALRLGEAAGLSRPGMAERMERLLERSGLPRRLPADLDSERLLALMEHDKKRRSEGSRWVMLEDWGRVRRGWRPERARLREVLDALRP